MPTIARDDLRKLAVAYVDATFCPLFEKHHKAADPLIAEALDLHYGKANLAKFRTLPIKLFGRTALKLEILVKSVGSYVVLTASKEFTVPGSRSGFSPSSKRVDIPKAGELADKVMAWAVENDRLNKERQELIEAAFQTVYKLKTDKLIKERWPEIAEFLPKPAAPVKPAPIAIRTDVIMDKLAAAKTPA